METGNNREGETGDGRKMTNDDNGVSSFLFFSFFLVLFLTHRRHHRREQLFAGWISKYINYIIYS